MLQSIADRLRLSSIWAVSAPDSPVPPAHVLQLTPVSPALVVRWDLDGISIRWHLTRRAALAHARDVVELAALWATIELDDLLDEEVEDVDELDE